MDETAGRLQKELGITRRELVRRGAIVGGTLLWTAPVIQTLGPAAYASETSPARHSCCYCSSPRKGVRIPSRCIVDDARAASARTCAELCNRLRYRASSFQSGPGVFTCGSQGCVQQ